MSGWTYLFSHDTPWDALQCVIDEETHAALLTFLETLLNDPNFSDGVRAQAWATAAPVIRRETRRALEDAWRNLQLEALPTTGVQ